MSPFLLPIHEAPVSIILSDREHAPAGVNVAYRVETEDQFPTQIHVEPGLIVPELPERGADPVGEQLFRVDHALLARWPSHRERAGERLRPREITCDSPIDLVIPAGDVNPLRP